LYIRCNILYYLSRSFGNWCSAVTVVTRQPENLFAVLGWDGDLYISHRVQPFSLVHPPSYGTGSGNSFLGVLPPSYGKGTGRCLEFIHPPMEWALEAVSGPSTLLWNLHWNLSVWGPSTLLWNGHWKLLGVHPPSFGWALEALCLGPNRPPMEWALEAVRGPTTLLWNGHWHLCLGSIHHPLDGHWKLSLWGPSALLWNGHWKLLGAHPPSYGMGTGSC
jgi:hypothetical protein